VFAEALRRSLSIIPLELSDVQVRALEDHFQLLNRWNKILNLTRIQDIGEAVERHYCESLFLGMHLPKGPLEVVDVGSGAGFPGVPLAVLRPDCRVALVESHQRKSVFLREATRHLTNTTVIPKRAELVTQIFDWAVSRAVKYSQLTPFLSTLAPNRALLAGSEAPEDHFTWNKIQLPWGERRYLWLQRST
jgi:16S rRNA (guanine527-N7)-methyltransferase